MMRRPVRLMAGSSLMTGWFLLTFSAVLLVRMDLLSAAAPEPTATEAAVEKQPSTVVPLDRNGSRHQKIVSRAKQGDVDLIFIGDSITQGWEGNGKEVWAERYGSRKAMNAGISGDRTEHVLWRLDHETVDGLKPKLVVMMIGTNNSGIGRPKEDSAEDIAAGIKAIVEKLRAKVPETKVLVLGVFPRGPNAEDKQRQKLIKVNKLVKPLADDKSVFFLDIGDKFLDADGKLSTEIMPDYLHLSPKGYQIWADAIEPSVDKLMK